MIPRLPPAPGSPECGQEPTDTDQEATGTAPGAAAPARRARSAETCLPGSVADVLVWIVCLKASSRPTVTGWEVRCSDCGC